MLSLKTRVVLAIAEEELVKSAEAEQRALLSPVGLQQAAENERDLRQLLTSAERDKAQNRALFAKLFEHGRTGNYVTRDTRTR